MYSSQQSPSQPQAHVVSGIQPGANVIIIPGYAPQRYDYPRYKGRTSLILGITQISLGIASIVLNSVAISFPVWLSIVGSGIWASVFYVIAGAFGIAARNKGRCLVVAHMVMSIIAAVMTACPFGFSVVGMIREDGYTYHGDYNDPSIGFALHALLLVLAVAEAVTAVMAAVLCCSAACSVDRDHTQPTALGGGGVQYVVAPGENNQLLLQPSTCSPMNPHGSNMPREQAVAPPPYAEKMPLP